MFWMWLLSYYSIFPFRFLRILETFFQAPDFLSFFTWETFSPYLNKEFVVDYDIPLFFAYIRNVNRVCHTLKSSVFMSFIYYYLLKKSKAVPLQAWSGPEGSRKLRFPDFMTTAQGGGKVVSLTHRPHLPPENSPATHFC